MSTENKFDRLFAQKLEGQTKATRPEAWEKLQARLEIKQDRKVVPIWTKFSAVASFALLLLAGGVVYFSLIKDYKFSQVIEKQTIKTGNTEKIPTLDEGLKPVLDTKVASGINEKKKETKAKYNEVSIKKTNKISVKPFSPIENNEEKVNEIAINIAPTPKAEPFEQKVEELKNQVTIAQNEQPTLAAENENLTIIFNLTNYDREIVKTPTIANENDKKASFFMRVVKQLKNAKNGDRVEWNEIGFKPAKILARAESKLKQGYETEKQIRY